MIAGVIAAVISLILGLAGEVQAQCTTALQNNVNTRTCTGEITGQQQVRGGNTEEKLILESGSITNTTNPSSNGILGRDDSGAATVTVEIQGGTVDASNIGINFDMGRSSSHPNGRSNVVISGGTIKAGSLGVNINHRPASTGGRITFEMTGGTIGESDDRVGTGLSAGINATFNTQSLDVDMTGGGLYATERGITLSHSSTGAIELDLGANAIINTSGTGNRDAGVFVSRNGAGAIMVNNAGRITSRGNGIYLLNSSDGAVTINNMRDGNITAANNGIYVRHGSGGDGRGTPGSGGNAPLMVTSSGHITSNGPIGISLDLARGDLSATRETSLELTGGTIRAMSTGVAVNSRTMGELQFRMSAGSIGTAMNRIGMTGVSLSMLNSRNNKALDVDLISGTIHARWRGLSLSHAGSGNIDLNLGVGSIIRTQESIITVSDTRLFTRGAGVDVYHGGTGAINIEHAGLITAGQGGGIYARHAGTGALTVTNTGDITAGFQGIDARRTGSGSLIINHNSGTITASQGPGIFARHDARRTSTKHDVQVNIASDVSTTSLGHPAVRASTRGVNATAGVRIAHTGGTLTGFGGIFVTDARFSDSTYTGPVSPTFTPDYGYFPGDQPKVLITVGNNARIIARGQAAGGADQLPKADQVARELVGAATLPRGITVGGGDYIRVARFIAAGDGNDALNDAEEAVLRAVYGTGDLGSALNALPDGYNVVYKNTIRYYAGAYNTSDFRVDVNNGAVIRSDGDGIRLIRRHNVNDKNGGALVNVDGTVTATRYGIRMIGAGKDDDGIRDQRVVVRGTVESTGDTGAAIALQGGGHVVIEENGEVRATSGTVIRVDAPDPGSSTLNACVRASDCPASDGADESMSSQESQALVAERPAQAVEGDNSGTNLVVQITRQAEETTMSALQRALGVNGRIVNPGNTRAFVTTAPNENSEDDPIIQLVPVAPVSAVDTVPPSPPSSSGSGGGTTSAGGGGGGGAPSTPTPPVDPTPTPPPSATGQRPSVGDTTTTTWFTLTVPESMMPANPAERMVSGAYGIWMNCADAVCALRQGFESHARVSEALPAVLLDLNRTPLQGEQVHHDGTGAWASLIGTSVDRDLRDSTATTSYSLAQSGVRLGYDFETSSIGTFGVSLHRQTGTAAIDHGGDIDTVVTGVRLSHRWDMAPMTVGLHATATSFASDLMSFERGSLVNDLSGSGVAVGMDATQRRTLGDATLTLGGAVTHQRVSTDGFTAHLPDANAAAGVTPVQVTDVRGRETTARLQASYHTPMTDGDWFVGGAVDLPLHRSASVVVEDTRLSAETRPSLSLQGGVAVTGATGTTTLFSLGYAQESGGERVQAALRINF